MPEEIIPIQSQAGIARDGTTLSSPFYSDGKWVRFQRGLPRKMGGYRSINKYVEEIGRQLHEYTQDTRTYLHVGSANKVERLYIDGSFNTSIISDRTPTSSFTADPQNLWQFASVYDTSSGNTLLAQVAPNLGCICNTTGGELFSGDLLGTAPLTRVTAVPANFDATGGVVALPPYAVVYGADGYVAWSAPNSPSSFTGSGAGNAYVTSQKIVRAMPLRGGPGNTPSGLFWSADSLIRASYVGGSAIFSFDTLSSQSSILSADCVVEYDGVYYWVGTDRFLMFNGVVREIPNTLNLNFFFDNLNSEQRQKVFGFKVPRFGEIWWCFPKGSSSEPNHAVVYNVRENTWYDTALPDSGRGAAVSPSVFPNPLMTGVDAQDYQLDSVSLSSGGSSYTAGDVLTISGGTALIYAELTVDSVNGGTGAILSVSVSNAGRYTTLPTNPVSASGGSGSGAEFDLTFIRPYKLWVHEVGKDAVDGELVSPVQSFFETAPISLPATGKGSNSLQVLMLEPDFVQSGDMSVQVTGRANARAPQVDGDRLFFADSAATPQEQVVYLKTQRRELRFRFESNTVGGDYQMGLVLAHVRRGDGTTIG